MPASGARRRRGGGLPACVAIAVLGALSPAAAQGQPVETGRIGAEAAERQVRRMEQALEQAVSRGVSTVERQLPALTPGLLLFAGSIQARGFVLDDYGVFFYVEYPAVRRSLLWSLGVLRPFDGGPGPAPSVLRRRMAALPDGSVRRAPGRTEPAAEAPADAPARQAAVDPEELYRTALRESLTDALMTYGGALPRALGEFDWLTVAARDGRGLRVRPGDRRTLQIRIRGGDLAALGAGRLSSEEVRRRVETRQGAPGF